MFKLSLWLVESKLTQFNVVVNEALNKSGHRCLTFFNQKYLNHVILSP